MTDCIIYMLFGMLITMFVIPLVGIYIMTGDDKKPHQRRNIRIKQGGRRGITQIILHHIVP